MGKTELLRDFLCGERFKQSRISIFVDVQPTASVWNLLDSILSSIGCRIPNEVLHKLRKITFIDIKEPLTKFFQSNGESIVIVFDHFENIVDSYKRPLS